MSHRELPPKYAKMLSCWQQQRRLVALHIKQKTWKAPEWLRGLGGMIYGCCEFPSAPTWLVLTASPSIALVVSSAEAFSVVIENGLQSCNNTEAYSVNIKSVECLPLLKVESVCTDSWWNPLVRCEQNTLPASSLCIGWQNKRHMGRHHDQFPLQLTAAMLSLIILYHYADCERLSHTRGHCAYGDSEGEKESSSASAGSSPPTGALCMKSVAFRTLPSHTTKGDSKLNQPESPAAGHKTADILR